MNKSLEVSYMLQMDNLTLDSLEIDYYEGDNLNCDEYCCWNKYHNKTTICFGNYSLHDQVNLTEWQPWEEGIRWSVTSILAGSGITGNILLITILVANRLLLRNSINVFILNMALADLTTAITGPVTFTIRDKPRYENWILGEAWCFLENPLQSTNLMISMCELTHMSQYRMSNVIKTWHSQFKSGQAFILLLKTSRLVSHTTMPFTQIKYRVSRLWRSLTEELSHKRDEIKQSHRNINLTNPGWLLNKLLNCLSLTVKFKIQSEHSTQTSKGATKRVEKSNNARKLVTTCTRNNRASQFVGQQILTEDLFREASSHPSELYIFSQHFEAASRNTATNSAQSKKNFMLLEHRM
ncbi:unnamed protein product [Meganyctiphanes norvegica]|uniref:G-protein coupled receptors family 1 profile domain-containing protein n=1 Tax=Meganyctiphanes norvegica TaxID=48144 RepID=A0AAV2QJ00_MEGNR